MPKRRFYACVAPSTDHKHYEDHNFMVVTFTTSTYRNTAKLLAKDHKAGFWAVKVNDISQHQKDYAKHFNDAGEFQDWLYDTDRQSEINIFLNQVGTDKLMKSHPHLFGL